MQGGSSRRSTVFPLSLLAPGGPIDVYQPMFIILNAVQDVPPGRGQLRRASGESGGCNLGLSAT